MKKLLLLICLLSLFGCSESDDKSLVLRCIEQNPINQDYKNDKRIFKFEDRKYQGYINCQTWNSEKIQCHEILTVLSKREINLTYNRHLKEISIQENSNKYVGTCENKVETELSNLSELKGSDLKILLKILQEIILRH